MNRNVLLSLLCITLLSFSCGKEENNESGKTVDTTENTPVITEVAASSEMIEGIYRHVATNLFDGDIESSWVEKSAGDGTGERIIITLKEPATLEALSFRNGFGVKGYWQKNNRVKDVTLTSDSGDTRSFRLKDMMDMQAVEFEAIKGTVFTITINSVYKGDAFNDTALAEIIIPGADIEVAGSSKDVSSAKYVGVWINEGEQTQLTVNAAGTGTMKMTGNPDNPEPVQAAFTWSIEEGALKVNWKKKHPWYNSMSTTFTYKKHPKEEHLLREGTFVFAKIR